MLFKRTPILYLGLILLLALSPAYAQRTRLNTGWNLFSTQQDVEMGRSLAQDVERTLDLTDDSTARGYITALGRVANYAPGYRYPYEFKIFNDDSIQSFALPGGKIYLSSGLVKAVQNEPQLAAIVAHQIGHVVARHGTREVSTAYSSLPNSRAAPTVSDAIARLNLRAEPGSVVMKYTTQEEREADIIAAQILYDSRIDPQHITSGFQRLSNQPASLTREFFRDHPAPLNRAAAVRNELRRLGPLPANLRGDSPDLHTVQRLLENEFPGGRPDVVSGYRPDPPSTRLVTYGGYDFEIRYPENWYTEENGDAVTLAPEGGHVSGSLAYGMLIDTFQPRLSDSFDPFRSSFNVPGQRLPTTSTLQSATDQLINDLQRSNPSLRVVRSITKRIAGEAALEVEMTNESPLGGREVNRLTTMLRPNNVLYYFLAVAPQDEIGRYGPVFDRMTSSIRFF